MNFESLFKKHLENHFSTAPFPAQKLLRKSLFYSLKAPAGRFRPQLCFAVTKALGQNPKRILPWAIALEMIHTASLIHDDLPLMDNAKVRRGKKCNHLVFGEDIALLAGTCLFVESFSLLKDSVFNKKQSQMLPLLISTAGFNGLMSGQAWDLRQKISSKSELFKMIRLKTGMLIEASVLGPLILWGKKQSEKKALKDYGKNLGQAYQLADNLQDKDWAFLSKKQTLKELKITVQKSLMALKPLGEKGAELKKLCESLLHKI